MLLSIVGSDLYAPHPAHNTYLVYYHSVPRNKHLFLLTISIKMIFIFRYTVVHGICHPGRKRKGRLYIIIRTERCLYSRAGICHSYESPYNWTDARLLVIRCLEKNTLGSILLWRVSCCCLAVVSYFWARLEFLLLHEAYDAGGVCLH